MTFAWDIFSRHNNTEESKRFRRTFDNPLVSCERRAYFRQNLSKEPAREGQDVKQMWFPGVHCDAGGGYRESESGLSKIALRWMIDEVGTRLTFHPTALAEMFPKQDTDRFCAPSIKVRIHRSLRGLWYLVEFLPHRTARKLPDGTFVKDWIIPPPNLAPSDL